MNINSVFTIILTALCIFFTVLSIWFYRRSRLIRDNSTESVMGTVVSYAYTEVRSPVVEYVVKGERYKKALRYSYITRVSSPFSSVKTSVDHDLLDTKLRLKNNRVLSINTIFQDRWPLDSQMKVYYNADNPKLGYVERYAKTYYGILFLCLAVLMVVSNIVINIIIK